MLPSSDPGALRAFLDDPSRPADMLRYHELQGFLFTIVCAPELVPPSEWLPIIFGEEEAGFATPDEAQEILGQIMALYNAINGSVLESPARLPEDCRLRTSALANLDDDAPIAQWSRGFIRGHDWLSDDWDAYLPDELDEEFHATFMPLTFFASRQMAEDFAAESSEHTLDGLAEAMACTDVHRHTLLQPYATGSGTQLQRRWTRNMMLNKWLEYCVDRGHYFGDV